MSEQAVIDQPTAQPTELAMAVQKVSAELAGFDKIAAGLAALQAEHPADVVLDVSKSEGMKAAIKSRAAWREPRIAIEKVRKAAKAPVLALGKTIDNFAESLTAQLRLGEDNYDGQIQAELTRKAEEKKRADEAESRRVLDIHARISQAFECAPGRVFGRSAAAIREEIQAVTAVAMDESKFAEFVDEAKRYQAEALADLRSMLDTREKMDADAERLRLEREEHEKQAAELKRQRTEFEAQQATLRAEQKKLDDARHEEEMRRAAENRARLDAEAAAERKRLDDIAAQERAEAAAKAEEERKAAQAERMAREEEEAKEAAKRARAARKLAAAQKAGPRLLEAAKLAVDAFSPQGADDLEGPQAQAMDALVGAIKEAEA